jgi:hypothetical protein
MNNKMWPHEKHIVFQEHSIRDGLSVLGKGKNEISLIISLTQRMTLLGTMEELDTKESQKINPEYTNNSQSSAKEACPTRNPCNNDNLLVPLRVISLLFF